MCTGSSCQAKVNIRFAVGVAVLGLLLFTDGLSLVVIGAVWDSITVGRSQLYVVTERQGIYTYNSGWIENNVLMYQGLLVLIPAIPAFLQLCKRARSTTILFLLSLVIGFSGSIIAATMGGIAWTNMQVVYQSYKDDFCKRDDTQCTCKLPRGFSDEKNATMFFADCQKIETLHGLVGIYFALSIIACLLTTIGGYLGCVGCCNPEEDPKETTRLVSSEPPCYSSVLNNPAAQHGPGFANMGMAPNHPYLPSTPGGASAPAGAVPPTGAVALDPSNIGKAAMASQQSGPQTWIQGEERPLVNI